MTGLPNLGARVRVWPMPGRRVLTAPFAADAPLLAQAMLMPKSGREVVWDYYWMEKLREGAILLHAPPCEEHDHGDDGSDDCKHCGRSLSEAQVYDVHYAHGVSAAKADAQKLAQASVAEQERKALERKAQAEAKKQAAADAVAAAKSALGEE